MTPEEILKAEPHELAKRAKELDSRLFLLSDDELSELNLIKSHYHKLTGMRITAKTLMYV